MRCITLATLLVLLLGVALPLLLGAADPPETKSALETFKDGWIDLLPEKDLKGWKRVPIPPGSKLSERDPWSAEEKEKMIVCEGAGIHEMLLYEKEFGDGVFHVEWRFKKVPNKKGYNSGVYVRTSSDGKVWHQAQVGDRNVGYLFGQTLVGDKLERMRADNKVSQRGKEAGEWNTYEVTCSGKSMTLWINGAVTAEWKECQVPTGLVGLEAEGWFIEFRNLKFRTTSAEKK
jgi:hypothetical protein